MKLNYTVLLKIGLDNHQNVILKSYFSSQAGQTEYKQTSHNKKNLWQRAKATQNHMYAGPAPFSLFTLCEPTQTRTETKIKFIMLKKTQKCTQMTRQLRHRARQIHMKSYICMNAYLLI